MTMATPGLRTPLETLEFQLTCSGVAAIANGGAIAVGYYAPSGVTSTLVE
jgi:hypothetical protein